MKKKKNSFQNVKRKKFIAGLLQENWIRKKNHNGPMGKLILQWEYSKFSLYTGVKALQKEDISTKLFFAVVILLEYLVSQVS